MMDLDALREAVERLDAGRDPWHLSADEQLVLAVAARAVLDSEEAEICRAHLSMWLNDDVGCEAALSAQVKPWRDPCKRVRVRLLAEEGT